MNLGVVRSQQQHYDQALAAFSHALSLAPKSEQCLADVGLTHFRMCHYVDAAKYLTAAIALNPNDETLHDALGYVYDQLGRYDDARSEWDRAKAMDHKEIIKHLEDAEPDDKTRNSS